jgi:hypothetical protein
MVRDLARRHVQNCSNQGHEVILPTLKRGRKRMSCDRCSQRKLSCDTKIPCSRCRSGATTCTYERQGIASSCAISHAEVGVQPSHGNAGNTEATASGGCGRISIDFLLNFTNPSGYGPSATIAAEAADLNIVEDDVVFWDAQLGLNDHHTVHDQPFCNPGDFLSVFSGFPSLMPERNDGDGCFLVRDCLTSDLEGASALEARIKEMVYQLFAQQSSMLDRNSGIQASFDIELSEVVFTVANVSHFLWGFFHYFHDQFPILHTPTFDSQTASLPLLLTVVLFGSMSSSPSDMSVAIRQFFDVAEAYVFDHLISKQMLHPRETWIPDDEVELLQAGLLFLILQNNSSDLTTRRRIRLQRIPALIAAVRALGLLAYKRQHPITSKDRPKWQLFVSDEARVRY